LIIDVSKVTSNSKNFIYGAWRREVKGTGVLGRWAQTEVHYVKRNLSTRKIGGGNDSDVRDLVQNGGFD